MTRRAGRAVLAPASVVAWSDVCSPCCWYGGGDGRLHRRAVARRAHAAAGQEEQPAAPRDGSLARAGGPPGRAGAGQRLSGGRPGSRAARALATRWRRLGARPGLRRAPRGAQLRRCRARSPLGPAGAVRWTDARRRLGRDLAVGRHPLVAAGPGGRSGAAGGRARTQVVARDGRRRGVGVHPSLRRRRRQRAVRRHLGFRRVDLGAGRPRRSAADALARAHGARPGRRRRPVRRPPGRRRGRPDRPRRHLGLARRPLASGAGRRPPRIAGQRQRRGPPRPRTAPRRRRRRPGPRARPGLAVDGLGLAGDAVGARPGAPGLRTRVRRRPRRRGPHRRPRRAGQTERHQDTWEWSGDPGAPATPVG